MSKSKETRLTPKGENLNRWYQEVIAKAELADHSPVKGCMVIRPYGYAIWEQIRNPLNAMIRERGAQNVSFPSLIPESFLAREKEHVEGFSPEVAVVTYAGGEELQEKLIVRPTSETIIHDGMKRWIYSYRDLPMKLNQWCSVIRWEKHPRLFLRTSEFQWQEGHTAHADSEEAKNEAKEMINLYAEFCQEYLAIPVVQGQKSELEKFAGAVESYSIEGLMPDGRSLQMGTAHYLGDNFSRAADVCFVDQENRRQYVEMSSWGVSTRLLGALIMVHGDDKGLVLPPNVAPVQVTLIPVSDNELVLASKLAKELEDGGIRTEIDTRKLRLGAKYYDSELRGVPIRIAVGGVEANTDEYVLRMRDGLMCQVIRDGDFTKKIKVGLDNLQERLLEKAVSWNADHSYLVEDRDKFQRYIMDGRGEVLAYWCGDPNCERSIKEATGAMSRNMPFSKQNLESHKKCVWCGRPAKHIAYFARAY